MFALHHPRWVFCAQAGNKVNFKKNPTPAEFCGRNLSALRHALQGDRMQVQELGGLLQVEGVHGAIPVQSNEPD